MKIYLVDEHTLTHNISLSEILIDASEQSKEFWRGYQAALRDVERGSLSPRGTIDSEQLTEG